MKKLIPALLCTIISGWVFTQPSFLRNTFYAEAGGNGFWGSVNYERQLHSKPGVGVRFGLGVYTKDDYFLTIPLGINYLFPLQNETSFIDAGIGVTFAGKRDSYLYQDDIGKQRLAFDANLIPSIGYRKQVSTKQLMWRISFTPVINGDGFKPWLGASIGKLF